MSILFKFDREAGYYVCTLAGVFTESDIRSAFSTLYMTPDFDPRLDRLIDLTRADLSSIPEAAFDVMARRAAGVMTSHGRPALRTAFVAADDVNHAQVEHYKRFAEQRVETVELFRDLPSAERWLTGG